MNTNQHSSPISAWGARTLKQGDTAKARAAYHDFLTLWKDADPEASQGGVREVAMGSSATTVITVWVISLLAIPGLRERLLFVFFSAVSSTKTREHSDPLARNWIKT
jgi:hypothetical protein